MHAEARASPRGLGDASLATRQARHPFVGAEQVAHEFVEVGERGNAGARALSHRTFPGRHQRGAAPCRDRGIHVPHVVADQPRAPWCEAPITLRLEDQSRPRLATRASLLGPMRADIERIDRPSLACHRVPQATVNRVQIRQSELSASDARLVGDDENSEPRGRQRRYGRGGSGQQYELFWPGDGIATIDVQDPITVEQNARRCRTRSLRPCQPCRGARTQGVRWPRVRTRR